jgi:hypothetical protein
MRPFVLVPFLTAAVLFPERGNAQVYQFRTPPPEVTAVAADWQINSEPVLVGGVVYYPTGGLRFFDGQVMAQIATFQGVPVYSDMMLEPFSVLYVPVGRDRVREYERRRDGELAGTTGSRVPSFPVQSPSDPAPRDRPVTTGTIEPAPRMTRVGSGVILEPAPEPPDRGQSRRTLVESIPRPSGADGVWLEFNGARWYADGPAAPFSPDRFEPVGEYHGFAVYRHKASGKDAIWVSAVKNGPLAPYVKR